MALMVVVVVMMMMMMIVFAMINSSSQRLLKLTTFHTGLQSPSKQEACGGYSRHKFEESARC
jgi:hypothetical protein